MEREEEEEDIVCLDASFFMNNDYQLTTFAFGSHEIELLCLQSASTDFDLTGQLVWPGALLMNNYLSKHAHLLQGCSIIELGSGVGITGILCSKFCNKVVLTDHNEEVLKILKQNIQLHASPESFGNSAGLVAEKLEWGNSDQITQVIDKYSGGFDLILGADICFQQSSVPLLFETAERLLQVRGRGKCKFILAYVSRAKIMDALILDEASRHGMQMTEVAGTRSVVGNLQGVIYEITLK
ncbi:protein N-lysine methyltransferase METTL21A [Cucurbita pepo subsp. pepo]|uniref:protein N-lysine methyltransferase METTL21A n=1 Tax=Cucurbita pepo subsp. pepo TaxID=3664 RepID=UPI000C9D6324|nr:protein N-lysine methyltransferase METTL21A [Cucurbita pepo subsp. pepo]